MVSGTGSCNGLDFGVWSDSEVQTDAVYCSGAFSCESGTYRGVAIINFDGESAGYRANVEGAVEINARGRNALDGARIDSGGITEMSILLAGDNAGVGATVICRQGSVCTLNCIGNACAELEMVCEGADTDCVVECDAEQGHACPTMIDGQDSRNAFQPKMVAHSASAFSMMADAMTSCEAAKECVQDVMSGRGDVSCTGDESCAKAKFGNEGDVACAGNMACSEATFTGEAGDISCTGAEACANGEYSANIASLVCSGSESCAALEVSSTASGGVSPECSGLKSCADAVLLMDTDAEVSCGGEKSCYGSEIRVADSMAAHERDASVICVGKNSCQTAHIAVNGISCVGGNSCQQSTMSVSGEVIFNGANSGLEAVIEVAAPSIITATGYNSLMKSQIDSAGNDVSIELSGWNAGGEATLRCRAGSACSLTCIAGGCFEMTFVCEDGAECTVSPAECADDAEGAWNVDAASYCPAMTTQMPADDSSSSKRGGGGGGHDNVKEMFVGDGMVAHEGALRAVNVDGFVVIGCAAAVMSALMLWWFWERMVARKEYVQVS